MMYAHCDNFLKESAKLYIGFLRTNPTVKHEPELMWLVMHGKLNVTEASDENYKSLIAYQQMGKDSFFDALLSREVFAKRSFKYKSLRFFCDWVLQINYNHASISVFCESLKEKRDSIAHGEESYIDEVSDCLPWHETTINFIDTLKDSILEHAIKI